MSFEVFVVSSGSAALIARWAHLREGRLPSLPAAALLFLGGGYLAASGSLLIGGAFSRWTDLWVGTQDPKLYLLTMFFAVALTEETCKLSALLLLDLRAPSGARLATPAGMVTVAAGFAAIENFIYAFEFGAQVLVLRGLLSTGGHCAFGWILGRALARSEGRGPAVRVGRLLAALALAAFLHGTWNLLGFGWSR